MYYISQMNSPLTLKARRLSDFAKRHKPNEGTQWVVRTQQRPEPFSFFPIYTFEGGKLRKTGDHAGYF